MMDLITALRCWPDAWAAVRGGEREIPLALRHGVILPDEARCTGFCGNIQPPGGCENLRKRLFAFHIHSDRSCTRDSEDPFADALTHYNLEACPHPAHAGNLPPLLSNHRYALQVFLTDRFTVREIIGRTVIILLGPDDFSAHPADSAGNKIVCGQIVSSR